MLNESVTNSPTLDASEKAKLQAALQVLVQRSRLLPSEPEYQLLTQQLPLELRINPNDQTRSKDEILQFYTTMKRLWLSAGEDHTAQKVAAKLCLQATGNISFCNYLLEQQELHEPLAEKRPQELTPYIRSLVDWVEHFRSYVEFVYSNYDELVSHLPASQVQSLNKNKILPYLKEKVLTYETFIRALYLLHDEQDTLKLLYARKPEDLHGNYLRLDTQFATKRQAMSSGELNDHEARVAQFSTLVADDLTSLNHYARVGDYPQLIAARFLFEHKTNELFSNNPGFIYDVLQFFNQEALRAVDRVNDVFGTDRYVYTLLEGQILEAPVRTLPFIYKIRAALEPPKNEPDVERGTYIPSLMYTAPTHPQAVHLMKKHYDITQLPEIFAQSIRFYAKGIFTQSDFIQLYAEVLAFSCPDQEITPELWQFIFTHVVVNEDSELIVHPDGSFSVPEWLQLSQQDSDSQLYADAEVVIAKVNAFCAEAHMVPPLRPYAVIAKETTFGQLSAVPNPDAVTKSEGKTV